ncbi:PAS and ANTAR domain-containing protein [Luteimicrobium sp. DT211]|uniref:PAS and ANTAR domain-containing protein n=1 Tax=Luteimicrobium sp. DT211 TaxID=3393412 RepID=UPI003CEE166F
MITESEKAAPAAVAGATPTVCVGRYDIMTRTWWWSDATYRLHGFEPGDVVPTTALILAHKHPDDRERVARTLERAWSTGEPFSIVHRIMDAHGTERVVSIAGQGRRDPETGELVELVTYWADATPVVEQAATERANEAIRAAAESRAAIEQAKGLLSFACRIEPEAAFELLRRASMESNVPVRDLACDLVERASSGELHPELFAAAPVASSRN